MKAFEFDHHLIDSYARFSRSFSIIRSDDLKSEINRRYDARRFWPDALLSLNPRYLQGATVDDLVASGDLDDATGLIFRFGATPIRFHRHQAQSIAKAHTGQSYVVTTGPGSGKSLCFFRANSRCDCPFAKSREGAQNDRYHRLSDERTGQQPDE